MKIAIIGAGISGLVLANELGTDHHVTVFEKARGVGGRMATRYADPYQFDHGAQFFTARTKEFQNFLAPLLRNNIVAEWTPKMMTLATGEKPYKRDWFEPHYVAVPKMNALCKYLADGIDISIQTRIEAIEHVNDMNILIDMNDVRYEFDWVISTVPADQAINLLPNNFDGYDDIQSARLMPCFTMMVGYDTMPNIHWDAAKVKQSPIEWIALNNSKQGRNIKPSFTVHSRNEWARDYLENDIGSVQETLLSEFSDITGIEGEPDHVQTHRWRYAFAQDRDNAKPFLLDEKIQIAVCGDWCIGGRVEAAYTSAIQLAKRLKSML